MICIVPSNAIVTSVPANHKTVFPATVPTDEKGGAERPHTPTMAQSSAAMTTTLIM